jgi:hypothetical protein
MDDALFTLSILLVWRFRFKKAWQVMLEDKGKAPSSHC